MIGVLVRFQYETEFDEARVRNVAEGARAKFEGMPGLRFKAFAVDAENRQALNYYIWESVDVAREFFSPQLVERVADLYGVRPSVQFVEIVALVENRQVRFEGGCARASL